MTLLKFTDVSRLRHHAVAGWRVRQIARGERVCIIGRNGTGKSSMLRLVKGDRSATTEKSGARRD